MFARIVHWMCILIFLSSNSSIFIQSTLPLIECRYSNLKNVLNCMSDSKLIECDARMTNPNEIKAEILGIGFFPTSRISILTNETRFPLYAKNTSSIDFKNYTVNNVAFTLHQSNNLAHHGIRIVNTECFKSIWELFKEFGKRKIISLETNVQNYLPTATIFGQIKLIE